MNAPPDFEAVAAAWLPKADDDLAAARYLLTSDEHCPTAIDGFHAQQCVEKSIKATLVRQGLSARGEPTSTVSGSVDLRLSNSRVGAVNSVPRVGCLLLFNADRLRSSVNQDDKHVL